VLLRVGSLALAGRRRVAGLLGLEWLRLGPLDLAVPVAAAVTVWDGSSQLGRQVGPLPFWVAWIGLSVVLAGLLRRTVGPSSRTLVVALLAQVLALWLLYDLLYLLQGGHLYDLEVYLGSAQRWLDGGHAYMSSPLASWPDSPRDDFFLYPPPLLPFFGLLARLPDPLVSFAWTVAMVACGYGAFRLLGLPRGWSAAMLAFPPVFVGFESGNVASLTFLLFVAGARAGGALVLDTVFKVQTGVPVLWLLRERRVGGILAGCAATVAIVVATLPIVGLDAWREWWAGLGYRAASQAAVPALYGYSYAKDVPGAIYVAVSIGLVAVALAFRGRRSLAALGLASIYASPTLWPHGFAFALPAVLLLENEVAVLAVLGGGAIGRNMWLLFFAGWAAVFAERRAPAGALHPTAGKDGPWPIRTPFARSAQLVHNRAASWRPRHQGQVREEP